MKKTTKSYEEDVVDILDNLSTHLSEKKMSKQKDTACGPRQRSSLPLSIPSPAEKRKKRHISFVALALLLAFTCLCILSLLNLQSTTVLADNVPSPSNAAATATPTATPTPPPAESAPPEQSVWQLLQMQNLKLGYGSSCDQYSTDPTDANPRRGFCWNSDDFWWGARDITCIYNPAHDVGAVISDTVNSISFKLEKAKLNQNTCTDDSTCVSTDSSFNDKSGDPIHSRIGGDSILCANNKCTNSDVGNTQECGDADGGKLEYDRFGCNIVEGTSNMKFTNNNPAHYGANIKNHDTFWHSTGLAINPTNYDPNGALYLPTTNLKTYSVPGPTNDLPECDGSHQWHCADGNSVVVDMEQGNFTRKDGLEQVTTPTGKSSAVGYDNGWGGTTYVGSSPPGEPVPLFWVSCDSSNTGWAFPCSDIDQSTHMPFISFNSDESIDDDKVTEPVIVQDWLSGNSNPQADQTHSGFNPGHLEYTYQGDTVLQPGVQALYGMMLAFGYLLISPVFILIGYQLLWTSWTFGHARVLEELPRVLLSVVAVGISYELATTLIALVNAFNGAIVQLHMHVPYQPAKISNVSTSYTLQDQGENDGASYRGIVVPITRWGCIANDFVQILSNKFWTDAMGFIPFVGGILQFSLRIPDAIDTAKHIGEFIVLIQNVTLCVQVFMRIVLLNYYILTAPTAFACWCLPGGLGPSVLSKWAKGFISLLFVQTIQLFVLTTFPLIVPEAPPLPVDRFGILSTVFQELPRILVLAAVIAVPKMMGTTATKAIAQAGTVAGGAVAAAGAMAYQTV